MWSPPPGQRIASDGLYFPGLLSWAWDLDYTTSAPYAQLRMAGRPLQFDASVRRDNTQGPRPGQPHLLRQGRLRHPAQHAASWSTWTTTATSASGNRAASRLPAPLPAARSSTTMPTTPAFSLGGTWMLNDESSVFARYSDGGRAIADRLLQIGGTLNADGSLTSTTDGYDNVEPARDRLQAQARPLRAVCAPPSTPRTEETNAEITSGLTFVREYEAKGLELEGQLAQRQWLRISAATSPGPTPRSARTATMRPSSATPRDARPT